MLSIVSNNKRKILIAAAAAVCTFFLWNVQHVFAQDPLGFVGDALANTLGGITYVIALGIGGLFIGIGGLALDITIQELIIKMGVLLKGDYGAGISQVWQIIRDLFNILFIFSFIFIGIKTILNSEDSGTRRALGHLIVAALFINFSLLIALTIIDFSNIAATQIYNLIIHSGGISGGYVDGVMKTGPNSITGAFMEVAGMNSFFGNNSFGIQGMDLVIYSILMMIFFVMTGIIFLFATYHVLYRFVALGIYLILSPVLFLGWVLPNFKSYTDKWLKGLLRQSFFAPAFLFLLYVSLMSLSKLKKVFVTGGEGYATIMDGAQMTPNGFTIFIFFAVVIGFLYASVKVGDMMGISGAKTAVNAIHGLRKGTQDLLYRNTAGRGFNWGLNRLDAINRVADSEKGTQGRRAAILARAVMGGRAGSEAIRGNLDRAANYGGKEAYDKAVKANTQRSARANAISNITAGLKSDDSIKRERAIADASNAQLSEMIKDDEGKRLIMENADKLSKSQYEALIKSDDVTDEFRKKIAQKRGEQIEQRLITSNPNKDGSQTLLEDVIGKADTSELEAIGFEKVKTVAGKLSAKQVDDWKDLTPTEKNQLKAERKKQLENEFKANPDKLFERITSDEERSKLPDSILTDENAIPHLNTNVLTKIVDNNGITQKHRAEIKERVLEYHNTSEVKVYESARARYEKEMRDYRKLDADVQKKTNEPTPPAKPKEVVKYERINEWFEKNNAGQRY